jgi:hypothetical protein
VRNNLEEFLNLRTLPARFQIEEAAWYLGFAPHDIAILVKRGLLKPLGNPPPNGGKYFAVAVLMELHEDVNWLTRASNAIVEHWRSQNASRSKHSREKSSSQQRGTGTSASTWQFPPLQVSQSSKPDWNLGSHGKPFSTDILGMRLALFDASESASKPVIHEQLVSVWLVIGVHYRVLDTHDKKPNSVGVPQLWGCTPLVIGW